MERESKIGLIFARRATNGERFRDGTLENAFDAGMLTAIMRRAGVLAAELERAS